MFSEEIFFQAYIEELEKVSSDDARSVDDAALIESRRVEKRSRRKPPSAGNYALGGGLGLGSVGAVLGAMMSERKRLKGALVGGALGGIAGTAAGYLGAKDEQARIEAAKKFMRLPKAEQKARLRDMVRRRAERRAHENKIEMIDAVGNAGSRIIRGY